MTENIDKLKVIKLITFTFKEKVVFTILWLIYTYKSIMQIAYKISPEKTDWGFVSVHTIDAVVVGLAYYVCMNNKESVKNKINILKGMLLYFIFKFVLISYT